MLDKKTIHTIEEFVNSKPRSMQEIAEIIGKNWRTADKYVQEIKDNFGTLDFRIFREGTRGALKIVYPASIEKISNTVFQESLEKEILSGKSKEFFSAFDIFQHVEEKNKKATVEVCETENQTKIEEFITYLRKTKKQLLLFSGNMSLINLEGVFEEIEELVKKETPIKIICRIDLAGKENIERVLALNHKYGKEQIEIHHREQPLRATLIDGESFRIKEQKSSTGKKNEIDKNMFIFYNIKDKEWAEWLQKIFWKMFNSSIDAKVRIKELNKLDYKN